MVPFVFGTQTAEKMKRLISPSNITFKTYHGLSHSAGSVQAGEGGGGGQRVVPLVSLSLSDRFLPIFVCTGNGGYQTFH